jgi:hypothetical protein
MRKIHLTTIILLFFSFNSFGQTGYFANDSLKSIGLKIIDAGGIQNARFCRVLNGDTETKYTPYEINEYGINKNRIYYAKDIHLKDSTKRVFLELLLDGKTKLFLYEEENYKTFFIQKDSASLVELPKQLNGEKDIYKNVISSFTQDCQEITDAIPFVRYNKVSLMEIIKRYDRCENKPFPFFKFGIIGGYELSKLVNPVYVNPIFLEQMNYSYNGFYFFGLFADIPIMATNSSVHFELYHSSHKFSETISKENEYYDFTGNQNSLKMPVLFRYYFYSGKINPFLNAGGILAYNYHHKNNIFVATLNNNIVEINLLNDAAKIPNFQYGYSAGAGTDFKLNSKNALFFELRFNKLIGQPGNTMNNNEIQFITGINF